MVKKARIVTGFGSIALSQYLVDFLRARADEPAVVLTPFNARAAQLRSKLKAEGIGETRVLTFANYASSLAGHSGPTALTPHQTGLLWLVAQGRRQALFGTGLLDALRANRIRSCDLVPLEGAHPAAGRLASLLQAYEDLLKAKSIADLAALLRAAADRIRLSGAPQPGQRYIFDLFHDARPDEFELALTIARHGHAAVFLCDPCAPPPVDRAVVCGVESELRRRLGDLPVELAPAGPNEELGRRIASDSLDALGARAELIAFNSLAGQCRGLARAARKLFAEGVPADEMAFFIAGHDTSKALLLYELEQAGIPHLNFQFRCGTPLEREAGVIFGLLADPGRNDLRAKAICAQMAKDETELEEKLSQLAPLKETVSLEVLAKRAFELLLPDLNELELQALQIYRKAASDFSTLAGSGTPATDLPGFLEALGPYTAKSAKESREWPPLFLTPQKGAARTYAAVFIPSRTSEMRRVEPRLVETDKLASALERRVGSPVHLPDARDAASRERWECGTAAAAGARVIFSFYRRTNARRIEPPAWLRGVLPRHIEPSDRAAKERKGLQKVLGGGTAAAAAGETEPAAITVKPDMSVSALKTYITCPHLFYLRHVLGLKTPPTERMSLGSLVHQVLAKFHRPPQTDFCEKRLLSLLSKTAAEMELAGETLDEAGALLSAYAAQPAVGAGETLCVERKFQLPLGGANIRGRIDRIVAAPGGVRIIEYKLAGKGKEGKHKNAVVERLDDVQLPIYTLALREMGEKVAAFSYMYLNYENTGSPHEIVMRFSEDGGRDEIAEVGLQNSKTRVEELIGNILAGCSQFQKGDNAPCSSKKGSPAWCGFSTMCTALGG